MNVNNIIPKILNDFLNYLTALSYSNNTIKCYCSNILEFFTFIKHYLKIDIAIQDFDIFILLQVKEKDIIAFLVYLNNNKENNPYTRERKMIAIKKFYKWLLSGNPTINGKNPTVNISSIKKVTRLPKYLNLEKAKTIQNIFTPKNCRYPIRNNTIITLFLSSGMRVSELVNTNLSDIDFENNCINIIGKKNKERKVYFSNYCKKRLLTYINIRDNNKKVTNINDALFLSNQNKRISIKSIDKICKKAYELMGLKDCNYTVHTLRHTSATIMYQYNKVDIKTLQEFLGHEVINSTEIYTHISKDQVRNAINSNPLNNFKKVA